MPASTHAVLRRAGATCAAAALMIGGTFISGAAAAPPGGPTPPAASSASAAPTAIPSQQVLPAGLKEAVKHDLGKSVAEFEANGELAKKAAELQMEVSKTDPASVVSVAGDTINVVTSAPGAAQEVARHHGQRSRQVCHPHRRRARRIPNTNARAPCGSNPGVHGGL